MENIKVSIIVPVYNVEKYLKRCLDSLKNQTYKNIEIIVIDDGSTDNSIDIIKKYIITDGRIKLISQKNQGPNIARKRGLEIATGEYVFFVDSDDWIELETVEVLVEKLKKSKADIIKFGYIKEPGKEIMQQLFGEEDVFIQGEDKFEIYNILVTSSLFNEVWNEIVKREIVEKSISNRKLNIGEDALLNYELFSKAQSIIVTNRILYHYYCNTYGITKCLDKNNIIKNINDIMEVYEEKLYYLKKWNLYENKYLKKCANRLLEFLVTELFKLYRINKLKDNELNEIYNLIFSNKIFNTYITYVNVNELNSINFLKKIYMRFLYKKDIKKMNIGRYYIKNIYRVKDLLKNEK